MSTGRSSANLKSNGLIRGPSSYTLLRWSHFLVVAFFVITLVIVGLFSVRWHGDVESHLLATRILMIIWVVVLALFIGFYGAGVLICFKEYDQGYSTLPWSSKRWETRDPTTGQVVKQAGIGVPGNVPCFTFKRLRSELSTSRSSADIQRRSARWAGTSFGFRRDAPARMRGVLIALAVSVLVALIKNIWR